MPDTPPTTDPTATKRGMSTMDITGDHAPLHARCSHRNDRFSVAGLRGAIHRAPDRVARPGPLADLLMLRIGGMIPGVPTGHPAPGSTSGAGNPPAAGGCLTMPVAGQAA